MMVTNLEARLIEVLMGALDPCDLGDGIEVLHDVEAVEIEMDCELDGDEPADDLETSMFVRHSAPYERIELQLDANAFIRATIEEARQTRSS